MKLADGKFMCDLDGCSSCTPKIKVYVATNGSHLCEYHTYLAVEGWDLVEVKSDTVSE